MILQLSPLSGLSNVPTLRNPSYYSLIYFIFIFKFRFTLIGLQRSGAPMPQVSEPPFKVILTILPFLVFIRSIIFSNKNPCD